MIKVAGLDHLVLTVQSIERCCNFYHSVLGMGIEQFALGRTALTFGLQKINLHESGKEFEPKALHPTPGSADLCLLCENSMDDILRHLSSCNIHIEQGPIERTGAKYPIHSVYFRDPDNNLLELSVKL